MNYIKIKTTTHNQKRLISFTYIKKPCHLYKNYICEMIQIADEIDRKVKPMDIPSIEYFYQRHEMHQYYLYISENPNDEMKLVRESHCLYYKDIETVYEFLVNVFRFLREVRIKDKIKGLKPILSRVEYLMNREARMLEASLKYHQSSAEPHAWGDN